MRDAGKTLKINTLYLLARSTDSVNYGVTLTLPLPAGSTTMTLVESKQYGGLHFDQKDISAAGIKMVPTNPPTRWSIRMTRPGGVNLIEDLVKKVMEVEHVVLVLGYQWA